MITTKNFDPEKSLLTINVNSYLIGKYFPNLLSMVERTDKNKKPSNLEVKKLNSTTVAFSFPIAPENTNMINRGDAQIMSVAIDAEKLKNIEDIVGRFTCAAIRKETSTLEFLPLRGYPIEDLKKDIIEAMKNKRNFCIIDTYKNYLNVEKTKNYVYNQYIVPAGTSEYVDIALLIHQGNMKELRKRYENKLIKVEWV